MPTLSRKIFIWYIAAIVISGAAIPAAAQSRPLLQDIKVVRPADTGRDATPKLSSAPLVKKTSSVDAVKAASISHSPIVTAIPVLENMSIPGYSGILVETLDGQRVIES